MSDIERYHDRPLDIEVAQGLDTLPPTVEGRRLTTSIYDYIVALHAALGRAQEAHDFELASLLRDSIRFAREHLDHVNEFFARSR